MRHYFLLSMMLTAFLGLAAGCGEKGSSPAPVLNLGLHADSLTGAIIVGEQDTLWEIAKRYRLPVRNIIDLNHLEPPYALARGRRLKLPAPVDYRVRGGDTLYSIASMFGVSVFGLVRVNGLQEPYALGLGQDLRIPAAVTESRVISAYPFSQSSPGGVGQGGEKRKAYATTLSSSQRHGFIWPVRGKVISGYGAKEGGLYNEGINIAAPKGTPVAAAAGGVVAYVGNDLRSYGHLVLIRHGGGAMTAYAHLDRVSVRKGAPVRRGQVLGTVGSTGAAATSQLHFEIRQGSKALDPKKFLG